MSSIRGRVIAGVLAGVLFILAVSNAGLYAYIRHALTKQFDAALRSSAHTFAAISTQKAPPDQERVVDLRDTPAAVQRAIVERLSGAPLHELEQLIYGDRVFYKVETVRDSRKDEFLVSGVGEFLGPAVEFDFAVAEALLLESQSTADAGYYEVWDEDELIARSPAPGATTLGLHSIYETRYVNVTLPSGAAGRAIAMPFHPALEGESRLGETLTLVLARPRHLLDAQLRAIAGGMLAATVITALCTVVVVRRSVEGGLGALNAVADETSRIGADNLGHRFRLEGLPREVLPICARLNDLFARLERAFARERRFTSDVAHELRTPIAELRSLAEVGLRDQDGKEHTQYLRDALAIAVQMERLVTALLDLARSESGQLTTCIEAVDVSDVVTQCWKPFESQAIARGLRVSIDSPAQVNAPADRALLSAIITNVFSNAVSYTPERGAVSISLHDGTAPELVVTNETDPLSPSDLQHMFNLFWRKDAARSDSNHSGVGLAVVAMFAKLLNLEVRAELPKPNRFSLTLRFPRQEAVPNALASSRGPC